MSYARQKNFFCVEQFAFENIAVLQLNWEDIGL